MRRDSAFGCCHPGESYKDSIYGESGIGVSGNDDIHCCLEFLICGGDPRFAVGLLEVFPSQGSEHHVDVGIVLHGLLEEVQDGRGDGRVETKHDFPKGLVINIEPGVDFGLVFGGLRCILGGLGFSLFDTNGYGFVVRGRKLVLDDLPLALGEEIVHHHRPPGLPVHRTVQDRHEGHEGGRHC